MKLPVTLLALIENALNTYLRLDGEVLSQNRVLTDKIIQLHISGLEIDIYSLVGEGDIQVMGEYAGMPDAVISGSLPSLIRLSRSDNRASMLLESDMTITGNMRVAEGYSRLLIEASIDWEELLSKVVGDMPAYQIGTAVRAGNEWLGETSEAMKLNMAEYLSEESRMVPAKAEITRYMEAVDTVRMATDRLEARIRQLETNASGDSPIS